MKSRFVIASGVAICIVAILAAAIFRTETAKSGAVPGSLPAMPRPAIESARQDALERVMRVFNTAPTMANARFGHGVRFASYRVPWLIGEALAAPDGVLYVSVTSTGSEDIVNTFKAAILDLGHLRFLSMEPARNRYVSMVFVGDGARPLLEAEDEGYPTRLFALDAQRAEQMPYEEIATRPAFNILSNGDRCYQPKDLRLAAVLYGESTSGKQYPVVFRAALSSATNGLISDDRLISLSCSSFAGQNYVTLAAGGNWGIVYRVDGRNLQAVSRGIVKSYGTRHMLIWQTEEGAQGPTGFQDYLDAVAP